MIKGNSSPRISLGRGCRQGDPISGYLFILAIEILLLKLAASPDIIPLKTKGKQSHLLEGYADDLTLFLKHFRTKGQNISQINAILKILALYEDLSGLAVNVNKTNMLTFGRHRKLDYLEYATQVKVVDTFKLLGIKFHPLLEGMDENYSKALKSARAELF